MRRYLGIALFLFLCIPALARQRIQGYCEQGGTTITVSGISSVQKIQQSFPFCTVTVYLAGTLTMPSQIYSDNAGTPLANPFTANADGSWAFYPDDGKYDVNFSGGGAPSPFTRGDFLAQDILDDILFATRFNTGSAGSTVDAACNYLYGVRGIVWVTKPIGTGWTQNQLDNCIIFDSRGTGDSTGIGNMLGSFQISTRSTADASGSTTYRGPLRLYHDDAAGGVNQISPPNKTQTQLVSGFYIAHDVGEHHGFFNGQIQCIGSGDCLSYMAYVIGLGGFGTGGDEGQVVFRGWNNVGDGTSGGGAPTNASATVSGNTLSGTWTNPNYIGMRNSGMIVTSRGTYSTGNIASAAMSGGICHFTGAGTSWQTQFGAGAHSNLYIRLTQFEAGTAKYIIPVTAVNNATDISVNYNINEIGATCPAGISASAYTIYIGSPVTAVGYFTPGNNSGSVTVADGAQFLTGDTVEQPIDSNVTMYGLAITQYTPFTTGSGVGAYFQNIGLGKLESGIRINGNSAGYSNGIRLMNTIDNAITANHLSIFFKSSDTTADTLQLFQLLNASAVTRTFTYDRANDRFNLGGFYVDGASSRISLNSTPQAGVAAYIGINNAASYGLDVANVVDPDGSHSLFRVFSNSNEHFEVNKAKAFFLGTGMNVGIGTASPGAKLQIIGDTDENQLYIQAAAGQGNDCFVFADSSAHPAFTLGCTGLVNVPAAINHELKFTNLSNNGFRFVVNTTNDALFINADGSTRSTGGLQVDTAAAKPSCIALRRGMIWTTESGAGVKDAVEVCAKDAGDVYGWRTIY